LSVMDRDSKRMRGDLPYLFTNLKTGQGLDQVVAWVEKLLPQHVHPHQQDGGKVDHRNRER